MPIQMKRLVKIYNSHLENTFSFPFCATSKHWNFLWIMLFKVLFSPLRIELDYEKADTLTRKSFKCSELYHISIPLLFHLFHIFVISRDTTENHSLSSHPTLFIIYSISLWLLAWLLKHTLTKEKMVIDEVKFLGFLWLDTTYTNVCVFRFVMLF